MLSNYIKIAIRNMLRNKLHSFINIMGLAIGIACSIMLLLVVREYISYDRHHQKHERIYMVQSQLIGTESDLYYGTSSTVGPTLKEEYPVIEEFVRNFPVGRTIFINKKGEAIAENALCYADPEIFKVFDHEFIYGSPDGALESPRSIVINRTLTRKYFGDENPVGKILSTNKGDDYKVTGVFDDIPHTTNRYYSALIPMMDYVRTTGIRDFNSKEPCKFSSFNYSFFTYILLNEKADINSITSDFERFKEKYIAECTEKGNADLTLVFKPIGEVLLNSILSNTIPLPFYYFLASLIFLSLFILIIACINYTNLATARSMSRNVEVGIRKVMGAGRRSLIRQFLCESIIITIIALLIALVLVELFLPTFNNLFELDMAFSIFTEPEALGAMLILILFVGILSGSYPAFFLSSLLPVNIFRGSIGTGKSKGKYRKLLIIVQFTLTIIILDITFAFQKQVDFWFNTDIGFNRSNILIIQANESDVKNKIPVFIREVSKHIGLSNMSRSLSSLWADRWEGGATVKNSSNELVNIRIAYSSVDPEFIDMMEIKTLEGRAFSREMGTGEEETIIVNEAFVKSAGWKGSPVGRYVQFGEKKWRIIGLIKDFHFESLFEKLRPLVLFLMKKDDIDASRVTFIKLQSENTKETLELIKAKWEELIPMYPFEYRFLKGIIAEYYKIMSIGLNILNYFSILCILVSCLGLFGLSSFMAERKTKEIGIRKVHGASVWDIFTHLSFDFLKLILISSVIAIVVSFFSTIMMLENFISVSEINYWRLFFITLCIVLGISLLTVSYHTIKAALTSPVKALRYE